MKKTLMVIAALFAICILFTGCGNEYAIKNENEIITDINEIYSVKNILRSEFVYNKEFEVTDFTIVKRQTNVEGKQDLVYGTVNLKSEYFDITADAELTYNYYDVGGWILDEHSVTRTNVIPLKAPEIDLVLEKCKYYDDIESDHDDEFGEYIAYSHDWGTFGVNSLNLVPSSDPEIYINEFGMYEHKSTFEFTTQGIVMQGFIKMECQNTGWKFLSGIYAEPIEDQQWGDFPLEYEKTIDYSALSSRIIGTYHNSDDNEYWYRGEKLVFNFNEYMYIYEICLIEKDIVVKCATVSFRNNDIYSPLESIWFEFKPDDYSYSQSYKLYPLAEDYRYNYVSVYDSKIRGYYSDVVSRGDRLLYEEKIRNTVPDEVYSLT